MRQDGTRQQKWLKLNAQIPRYPARPTSRSTPGTQASSRAIRVFRDTIETRFLDAGQRGRIAKYRPGGRGEKRGGLFG